MKKFLIRLVSGFILVPKVRRVVRRRLFEKYIYLPKKLRKYQEIKKQWLIENNGAKLVPGRYSEYDVVFAVGAICPMTSELIAHKLRTFANPFDWTGGIPESNWLLDANVLRDTRFLEKITLLCSGFVDFFNKDDIQLVSSSTPLQSHIVHNVRTKMRFLHLFPGNKSLYEDWDKISLKMKERCDRLIEKVGSSRRVLICWGHRMLVCRDMLDATVSDADIKNAVKLLSKTFPNADIDIVFFEHDENKKGFEYEKLTVCDGAYRIRSNHYVVTSDYEVVCESAPGMAHGESLIVAEALDNISLSCNE